MHFSFSHPLLYDFLSQSLFHPPAVLMALSGHTAAEDSFRSLAGEIKEVRQSLGRILGVTVCVLFMYSAGTLWG